MTRLSLLVCALALGFPAATASAQNREHLQMFADLRMLQEQVQRLQLSVNTLAEQIKTTQAAAEAQAGEMRKGFADQGVAIGGVSSSVKALGETEKDSAIRIAQLNQEMKAIREALGLQQTAIGQIIDLLSKPPVTDPAALVDPGGAAKPPAPLGSLPASPATYYNLAWSAYAGNQFEEAIRLYEDALKRFPDSIEAPAARMTVGEAYLNLNRTKEALVSFTSVISLHKDSDEVPNAYYKQGDCYERLGQKAQAEKSYQHVRSQYPDSAAAPLATQALRRMGVIKN
jgi:TolA-binding protein